MKFKKIFIILLLVIYPITTFGAYLPDTPARIEQFMRYIIYERDRGEYWQTPEETLLRKKGDCDDFAILSYTLLKKAGYECKLVAILFEESGHAVTMFKTGDYWNIFDLNWYVLSTSKSLPEFFDSYYGTTWISIWEINPKSRGNIRDVRRHLRLIKRNPNFAGSEFD